MTWLGASNEKGRAAAIACALAVLGCGPTVDGGSGSASDDGTGSSGAAGTEASATATGPGTTVATNATSASTTVDPTVDPTIDPTGDTGSTDGGCGTVKCEPCGPGCVANDYCEDGMWFCECACDDPCPAMPEQTFAEMSKSPPVDCGSASPDLSSQAWEALHDCVIAQSEMGAGFWADWTTDGDPYAHAIAGAAGFQYAVAFWESSGFGTVTRVDCSGVVATAGCIVASGEICLECVDPGEPQVLCDPK